MHCQICGGDIYEGQPALLSVRSQMIRADASHVWCTLKKELLDPTGMGTFNALIGVETEHFTTPKGAHGLKLTLTGVDP